jgi:hypothetical protein
MTFFVGEVGKIFEWFFCKDVLVEQEDGTFQLEEVAHDISTATSLYMRVKKSNNEYVQWDLTQLTDGLDGLARYTNVEGDFDDHGWWKAWGHAVGPGFHYVTDPVKFPIGEA